MYHMVCVYLEGEAVDHLESQARVKEAGRYVFSVVAGRTEPVLRGNLLPVHVVLLRCKAQRRVAAPPICAFEDAWAPAAKEPPLSAGVKHWWPLSPNLDSAFRRWNEARQHTCQIVEVVAALVLFGIS